MSGFSFLNELILFLFFYQITDINLENNIFDKIEEPLIQLVPASIGKRLANYLIDSTLYSFLFIFLLKAYAPDYPLENRFIAKQPFTLSEQLLLTFIYGFFMSAMEALLKGKSVGKLITGTRAVTAEGMPISSQTAFMRGLIRIIPFEQVSALSLTFDAPYPWHDRWSGSIVVDEAKSILPKK